MKFIHMLLLFFISASANDAVHTYAKSEECKACHPQIYNEYYGSMHANATPQKDPIHKAVWDRHPQNLKQERYGCGKCHTPTADNLDKMKTKGQKALPDANNQTHQEAISCAYCHRIKSIELHKQSNTNIMTNTQKNYFGTMIKHMESPFHGIVSESNEHMKNGNVCVGCHSHKMNKHGLNVCSTNIDNELNGANCVSCHMPKVEGSVSLLHKTKKHAFHGFAGSHFHSEMLTQYVNISLLREINGFKVNIDNQTSHALLLHPLRVAVLKVSVTRDAKTTKLKDETFVRVIGADGKPAMPWAAKKDIKNTMIKANEKRVVKYDFKILKGDKVDVVLVWFLVNPKAVKKLGLEDEKIATEFNVFKKQSFNF
ncbi:multiheme c-type cytochrome [Sulfurimonas sp.]|uniref:multiheme c-type cytochrome n=1 Tax=Sulfurimonas sp. TaxID=2022749 RepID=UPI0035635B78